MSRSLSPALKGPAQIALGLGISGAGTLVMIAAASRLMSQATFASFVTWWVTATLVAVTFGVFEVYLARSLVGVGGTGPQAPAIRGQLAGQALLLVLIIAIPVWLATPWLSREIFGGATGATIALPVFALVAALQALQRGSAVGVRRFDIVGLQLSVDGVLRPALVVGMILLFPDSVLAAVAGTLLSGTASIVCARLVLRTSWGLPRPFATVVPTVPVAWLLVGSIGPVLIGNLVVPWFAAMETDPLLVGGFGAALTISRIPTQFVSAAFAPIMVSLAALVESGDDAGHRRALARALRIAAILGVAFVALYWLVGPWLLSVYVGSTYAVPRWVLALLAAASAGLFVAAVEQASLAALQLWRRIAISWLVGAVGFGLVLLLPADPLLRASLAPLVAVVSALAVMIVAPGRHSSASVSDPRSSVA
jgi:O-antigen/teichoic acid export membrane protein